MRKSLIMFIACAPFYGAVAYGMALTLRQFPDAGVQPIDWMLLFAMGVVIPFLQSLYLVRELEKHPITNRIRWMAVWPSAMASVTVLLAITMIRRAMEM